MKLFTVCLTLASFLSFEATPLVAQTVKPTVSSPAAQTNRPAPPAGDGGWPRGYTTPSGAKVILYQPQVASWPDQKKMTLYAAVSYQAAGAAKPALGSLKIESDTRVALVERLVNFSEFTIAESSFPTLEKDAIKTAVDEIKDAVPRAERVIALDRVLASVDTSQIAPRNMNGVKSDPPRVYVSQRPAVLVNLDGDPIWSPIAKNELKFAVNTNWDLFQDAANRLYLRVDKAWLSAPSINGPWTPVATLPASFAALPADGNWDDVRAALPAKPATGHLPVVLASTIPAELILIDGAPKTQPVTGTQLLWVSNTESDVFRLGAHGAIYYLVSGRWFSSPGLDGPWTFATPSLPADFTKIPLDHSRSRVLASVPGTRQSLEAVLLAQVPQTARVNRKELQAPAVSYQGEPRFDPIERTTVARAVNTDKDILKVGDLYYMCFQGVWFYSSSPSGPWQIADSVPGAIYEIPISSPSYNVTHVVVEDYDDEWVDFAAAAAYGGMMVAWGTAMWGSGYYYPPYVGWSGLYPAYLPNYPSYGYGARYNPWTGNYSRGGGIYGPNGGAGFGARYNPSTGTYARGAVAYGPGGARGAVGAYNPRTGTSAGAVRGSNVYGSWGSTAVQRGDQWARTTRATRNATGNTGRLTQGSGGGAAISRRGPQGGGAVGRTGGGDVYAGRDGNVYRSQGGSWQKYGGSGNWNDVNRPAGTSGTLGGDARNRISTNPGTLDQLNRDRGARYDGSQRTRDRSRASGTRSGSYRPSGGFNGGRSFGGGGMRGGGGRRR